MQDEKVNILLVDDQPAKLLTYEVILRELGGGLYYVDDWTHRHANFFRSIQLTKSALFLILLLVVGVAAFNIVSTLVMVVKDKQADIAILRTVGATPRSVLGIFMTQGTAIGVIGTLCGVLLGVLLSVNAMFLEELSFHLYPRPRQQLKLFAAAILENFGYRQLNSVWRLMGLVRWALRQRGRSRWGRIHRHASWQHAGEPQAQEASAG